MSPDPLSYDLRAIATDKAGYSTTSEVVRTYVANTFAVVLAPLDEILTGTETASPSSTRAGGATSSTSAGPRPPRPWPSSSGSTR